MGAPRVNRRCATGTCLHLWHRSLAWHKHVPGRALHAGRDAREAAIGEAGIGAAQGRIADGQERAARVVARAVIVNLGGKRRTSGDTCMVEPVSSARSAPGKRDYVILRIRYIRV